MILYNPKDWYKAFVGFHRSGLVVKLWPSLLFIGGYAFAMVFLEKSYWKLSVDSPLKNVIIMHTLLGFAISMLLVFRTNTAYDRWWEGRKLWGGLTNNSRNLALKMHAFLLTTDTDNRRFYVVSIRLFAFELKAHLLRETTRLALDTHAHPEIPAFDSNKHVPLQVTTLLWSKTHALHQKNILSDTQLLMINAELQSFMDICGACERIKNTPIPFGYSAFIKKFILIYVITLPVSLAFTVGYFTIPITIIIFYVLTSLELVAEEIEDPFGNDSNDLPMHKMAEIIGQKKKKKKKKKK